MAPIPKSKLAKRRTKQSSSSSASRPTPPGNKRRADAQLTKTATQLHTEPDTQVVFDDPYGDEYEDEQVVSASGPTRKKASFIDGAQPPKPVVFKPGKHQLQQGESLVCDETAYDIFYKCNVEWPAMSFDYICTDANGHFNNINPSRLSAYPLSITLCLGTQANTSSSNKLVFARMSNLHRNPNRKRMLNANARNNKDKDEDKDDDSDDDSDEESDDESDDEEGDMESGDEENEDADGKDPVTLSSIDMNGVLQSNDIKMDATINRIRVMPQRSQIAAYWNEKGRVSLVDASANLDALYLDRRQGKQRMGMPNAPPPSSTRPFYSTRIHGTEGYGLDWSRVAEGHLLSGACDGSIYLSRPTGNEGAASWTTVADKFKSPASVEDIQWSPAEANVFASCHAAPAPHLNVWDCRQYRKPALSVPNAHAHRVDINVISWNRSESHLLASGADDGVIKVWDLRMLSSSSATPAASSSSSSGSGNGSSNVQAAAEFALHKKAITSIQWHPVDASMLCASSEDGSVSVWDLAVERDAEEELKDGIVVDGAEEFPPQLLFIHMGQTNVKDAQWHPACPSLIVSTAEDGINIFQPANIALPT